MQVSSIFVPPDVGFLSYSPGANNIARLMPLKLWLFECSPSDILIGMATDVNPHLHERYP